MKYEWEFMYTGLSEGMVEKGKGDSWHIS